ncbi:ferredoxin--NADP reductase [Flavobacteriaceae bacterium]|nr:ferredoxin--NADP reductase [Flavobacteriaceae bacterium]MDA9572455.1 ferredoxin--NADP reductase [Flavobacteriaceae bacterium]MDB3862541.1 ferredoxin--NADP reductase [Flavobacteriaceae bacterium]
MSTFYPLRVSGIERTTSDAVVVSFEVPDKLKSAYSFTSGQYISLEAEINGALIRRSYSLCSTPEEKVLSIGVKEVYSGVFSSYINQSLKQGDTLNVSTPEGRFIYEVENENNSVLAIAAGSGITPIFSILNSVLTQKSAEKFTLIYGNKTPDQTMFYKELQALEEKYPNQLKIHWVFSQSNEDGALFGRIDASVINFALNQLNALPDHSFLCGPETLILACTEELTNKGVLKEAIHFELFTASTETIEIENKAVKGRFTLTCDDVTHHLELVPDKTLLDIALNSKLEVPYSCQGGVCSSCIAKVKEGKASMLSNQILTDSEIEEGLVLSCQAVAQSDFIHLDYDDV